MDAQNRAYIKGATVLPSVRKINRPKRDNMSTMGNSQ
jgi:hypothetical protein